MTASQLAGYRAPHRVAALRRLSDRAGRAARDAERTGRPPLSRHRRRPSQLPRRDLRRAPRPAAAPATPAASGGVLPDRGGEEASPAGRQVAPADAVAPPRRVLPRGLAVAAPPPATFSHSLGQWTVDALTADALHATRRGAMALVTQARLLCVAPQDIPPCTLGRAQEGFPGAAVVGRPGGLLRRWAARTICFSRRA